MENGGQREFSFVVDMAGIRSDVYTAIKSARIAKSREKLAHFKLANEEPMFEQINRNMPSRLGVRG
jgi:hypothetical protein